MTDVETAWLAGLFEGEGCIDHRGKGRVCLHLAMTDEDVVRRCFEVSGMGTFRGPLRNNQHPTRKLFWRWCVAKCDDAIVLLKAMQPYLGARRGQRVVEVLEAWDSNMKPKRLWTHCSKGHPYNERNLHVTPTGARSCRPCCAAIQRKYRPRRAEQRKAG